MLLYCLMFEVDVFFCTVHVYSIYSIYSDIELFCLHLNGGVCNAFLPRRDAAGESCLTTSSFGSIRCLASLLLSPANFNDGFLQGLEMELSC